MMESAKSATGRKNLAKDLLLFAMKSDCPGLGIHPDINNKTVRAVSGFLKMPSYVAAVQKEVEQLAEIEGAKERFPEIDSILERLDAMLPEETMKMMEECRHLNPAATDDEKSFRDMKNVFLSSIMVDGFIIRLYADLDLRRLNFSIDDEGVFATICCKSDTELQNTIRNTNLQYMGKGLLMLAKKNMGKE